MASDPLSPTGLAPVPHILSYCFFGHPVNARAGRCSVKAKQGSKSAWRGTGRIVALAVLSLVALMMVLTLFSLVLRYGGPRVRDKIRLLNKRVLNPALTAVGLMLAAAMVAAITLPNKAEHPGLMTERAGPVMNSNQFRSSERI